MDLCISNSLGVSHAKSDRASEVILSPSQQGWSDYLCCLWHKIQLTADPDLMPECTRLEEHIEKTMKGTREGV